MYIAHAEVDTTLQRRDSIETPYVAVRAKESFVAPVLQAVGILRRAEAFISRIALRLSNRPQLFKSPRVTDSRGGTRTGVVWTVTREGFQDASVSAAAPDHTRQGP